MMSDHVLVGVDGSPPSLAAAQLAAHEAKLRGCPLRVVHVDPWANHAGRSAGPPAAGRTAPPQQVLRAVLARVAAAEPDVKVTTDVLAGDAGAALIDGSADAVLAVVGHRGASGFAELLLGSVSAKLAAHAHCPVIVVRGAAGGDDVVVGVDGSRAGDPAIGFAFSEADRCRAPVLALHAATGPQFSGPSDALIYDWRAEEGRAAGLLGRAVADWHEQFPDLLVQRRVRWGAPGDSLVNASRSAQLVVVGRRGGGGFHGLRLGGVAHVLLHHAACPVAVVPSGT
jgi:nucleotide-binding universal stress UspA family protein